MKRIIVLLMALLVLIAAVPIVSAAESDVALSEVEKDIANMTFDGKAWDSQAFLGDRSKNSVYLMAIDEIGFELGASSETYGVYLYFYNPSKKKLDLQSTKNTVQMAVAWEENEASKWDKFFLDFVSASEDNTYLKYRVRDRRLLAVDHLNMQERVAKMQSATKKRLYEISSFELKSTANPNATDYPYGCKVEFMGYDAGMGPGGNNASTKAVTYKASETLKIDVQQCYWRSETSSLGVGHKNQINAAYFAIPNSVWDKYESLYSMTCEWYEYEAAPMIFSDDLNFVEALKPYIGVYIEQKNNNVAYELNTEWYNVNPMMTGGAWRADWGYNVKDVESVITPGTYQYRVINRIPYITWLFHTPIELKLNVEGVSAEEVLDYYYNSEYQDLLLKNEVDEGRTAGYNLVTINMEGTAPDGSNMFPLENYASNHTWLEELFAYNIFNGGASVKTDETYSHFSAIEVFRDGDEATKKLLNSSTSLDYIMYTHFLNDEYMAADFRDYVKTAIANDKTVVMFRYAETDYFSDFLEVSPDIDGHACIATQTVFLNFDVIELGFFDHERKLKIIPVANDPEDVIGGLETPPTGDFGQAMDQLGEDIADM